MHGPAHIKSFNCVVNLISYEKEVYIGKKLKTYLNVTDIVNNTLGSQ